MMIMFMVAMYDSQFAHEKSFTLTRSLAKLPLQLFGFPSPSLIQHEVSSMDKNPSTRTT
jgi:hypothetical protein